MSDMYRNFILAYFKEHDKEYSFCSLAEYLGIPISMVDDCIEQLICDGLLIYNANSMLSLTEKGRLSILNQQADFFSFDDVRPDRRIINPAAALPLDAIYVPNGFISKLK